MASSYSSRFFFLPATKKSHQPQAREDARLNMENGIGMEYFECTTCEAGGDVMGLVGDVMLDLM